MLIIGSRALIHHFPDLGRTPNDWDFICTFEEFQKWSKQNKDIIAHCVPLSGDKFHVRDKDGMNYEFEIAWPGTSGATLLEMFGADEENVVCSVSWLYALKMSHRYLKDSPHFLKTMRDIQFLRTKLLPEIQNTVVNNPWFRQRELETYTYKHPKLDVSKGEFFAGDGVQYVYDHDTIHLAVAMLGEEPPHCASTPAYTFYMKDGAAVMTSKDKFFAVSEQIRLYGVYEESCVLALERSQITHNMMPTLDGSVWFDQCRSGPTPRWSFEMALMKVCTSITSGWFREYAWENYDKVMALYETLGEWDYVYRFQRNAHLLKPHTVGMMG